jgi:hypothetical protein
MKVIAYTWQADTHCPGCTRTASRRHPGTVKRRRTNYDEHGVWDGFPCHPVFETDETCAQLPISDGGGDLACGSCLTVITKHYDSNEDNSQ